MTEYEKKNHYFAPGQQRQVSIFLLNVHFILPLELICSPLLLAYLLTGGFLLKHKFYQFPCLDHRYRKIPKISPSMYKPPQTG